MNHCIMSPAVKTARSRLRSRRHSARHTTADRMAAHQISDRCSVYLCAGGLRKRVVGSSCTSSLGSPAFPRKIMISDIPQIFCDVFELLDVILKFRGMNVLQDLLSLAFPQARFSRLIVSGSLRLAPQSECIIVFRLCSAARTRPRTSETSLGSFGNRLPLSFLLLFGNSPGRTPG